MSVYNGIGTTYYGKAKKLPDGSYVATKWFVIFGLPLIPLSSARLHDVQKSWGAGGEEIKTFQAEQVSLYLPQIFLGYVISAALIAVVVVIVIVTA